MTTSIVGSKMSLQEEVPSDNATLPNLPCDMSATTRGLGAYSSSMSMTAIKIFECWILDFGFCRPHPIRDQTVFLS